jgi:spore maturation protein CgeB
MKLCLFTHSLRSCWNHGNAHFLRGVVSELVSRGHDVQVFEPADGWSAANLAREQGEAALDEYRAAYPGLRSVVYGDELDLDRALDGADLVLVHEWNHPDLVARIGRHRRRASYRLFFHDTHHRGVTAPDEMARFDLRDYDGVLAYGRVLRDLYLARGWAGRAWTWHEAADVRVFRPIQAAGRGDLVWIGNWGDGERSAELAEFLFEPARALGLCGSVYGVRYPDQGRAMVGAAGLTYEGWMANHRVPSAFAGFRVTVHVPRRPYVDALPGIPTIRPFEALACGIPLVSSPWRDDEGLFTAGRDYLVAETGADMKSCLRAVLRDPELAAALSEHGRNTILSRHTCAHRVDQLLGIDRQLRRDSGVRADVDGQQRAPIARAGEAR